VVSKKRVAILGASGYTGMELARLLHGHPWVEIIAATSESYAGKTLAEMYPALLAAGEIRLRTLAETKLSLENVDLVFLALPHGESQQAAPKLLDAGLRVIDLSGDFRLKQAGLYDTWYGAGHKAPEYLAHAQYGLPELYRQAIPSARLIANPGCYVTAAVLGCLPLLASQAVDSESLILDAKSGVSGAGRTPKPGSLYAALAEDVVPYKTNGTHQHIPEMEMVLSEAVGKNIRLTFTPQLVPARRGILITIYARLLPGADFAAVSAAFEKQYHHEPFVRVKINQALWPTLAMPVGTNCCLLGVSHDPRTRTVLVTSALDNLIKGAAGQAIQNMNLVFGFEETLALPQTGMQP
jgi:N-acetyl-gamma-glutamyl-phosphate reductase